VYFALGPSAMHGLNRVKEKRQRRHRVAGETKKREGEVSTLGAPPGGGKKGNASALSNAGVCEKMAFSGRQNRNTAPHLS